LSRIDEGIHCLLSSNADKEMVWHAEFVLFYPTLKPSHFLSAVTIISNTYLYWSSFDNYSVKLLIYFVSVREVLCWMQELVEICL